MRFRGALVAAMVAGLASAAGASAPLAADRPPTGDVPEWVARLPAGICRRAGRVYSVVRAPVRADDSDGHPELIHASTEAALHQLFVAATGITDLLPPSRAREDIAGVLLSCCMEKARLAGVDTVLSGVSGGEVVVIRCVPEARFRAIELAPEAACDCLRARVDSGSASPHEVMALVELQSACTVDAQALRSALVAALGRMFGEGVSLTLQRRWVADGGRVPAAALQSWADSARSMASSPSGTGAEVSAFPPSKLAQFAAAELAVALGRRMHDPNLLQAFLERFRSDGWKRCASLLACDSLRPARVLVRGASGATRDALVQSMAIPSILLLLLSDGDAPVTMGTEAPAGFAAAKAAFDAGTAESLAAAMSALEPGLRRSPDIESVVLMSAVMLSVGEPALARPLALAAYRTSPGHRYAGVNLLRALRALGRVDEARPIASSLRAGAALDDWGRRQLAEAESWIAGSP